MKFSSSTEELINCLKQYTYLLKVRNNALAHLSQTSAEMRAALENDRQDEVDELLARRQKECEQFALINQEMKLDEGLVLRLARMAATDSNAELRELGETTLKLVSDSETLGESILACQYDCENILKSKLQATSEALQKSVRRRKLDNTYGPAIKHQAATPAFFGQTDNEPQYCND